MAGLAKPDRRELNPPLPPDLTPELAENEVKLVAAKLYGRGFSRAQIARALKEHLMPHTKARTEEQVLHGARSKLKRWEMTQSFRDMVWEHAVIALDMSTPSILEGVGRRAKRGDVQAARLALEVTGRHSQRELPAQNVTIQIANIPRPATRSHMADIEESDAALPSGDEVE